MKIHRRIVVVGLVFTLLCSIYLFRLALLQWFPTQHAKTVQGKLSYSRNWRYDAVRQRQNSLLLHRGRALFVDEQGQLIHSNLKSKLLITPYIRKYSSDENIVSELSTLLGLSASHIQKQLNQMNHPTWLLDEIGESVILSSKQVLELEKKRWFGLYTIQTIEEEVNSNYVHIVGFTAENPENTNQYYSDKINKLNNWSISSKLGVIGLERSLDQWLHGVESEKIAWYEDIQGNMIEGLGLNYIGKHDYYPLTVQTTLNLDLQQKIEKLIDKQKSEGIAVVLLDVKTNDVKAMASKPKLFPRKLDEHSMKNLAITSHRPGSIYKLITLVAALEYGVVQEDEQFICHGEYGKYGLSCWKHGGHGKQTLQEAFANSCNVAFAQISERLTARQLHETALTLGAVEAVGWKQQAKTEKLMSMLMEEERGRAFIDFNTLDKGEIAQASIGQRDALMTPLQAATVVAAIARGGQTLEARVAKGIHFKDGKTLVEFKPHKQVTSRYSLKSSTIKILQRYMGEVVENGTGQPLRQAAVAVAGKSGTAQLGSDGASSNNYWFVGYFPRLEPKYALAVVVLNEKQSTNPATMLFKQIVDEIYSNRVK